MKDSIFISDENLRKWGYKLFSSISVPKSIFQTVVDNLVDTSLRGVDSHGIRLIPHYIKAVILGRINRYPTLVFKKTAPSTGVLDADNSFGIVAGLKAMHHAITLAKKTGVGAVTVKNSSHFGAAAIYSLLAARNNMLGLSFTNTDSLVLPYGGKYPFLGTNPICFTAPVKGEDPFCLDMATSQIPWNKVLLYRLENRKLEKGWAADKNGKIVTDPNLAYSLLPIGLYKGYGLALMVEIFSSILTGMSWGPHVKPMYPLDGRNRSLGHFFMAIDISKFEKVSVFRERLKKLLNELRLTTKAAAFNKVMVPGDPEKESYKLRSKKGIPLSEKEVDLFANLTKELNISDSLFKI